MNRKDIDNIISIICPKDEDFEKPIISPAFLKKELEALALEQDPCINAVSRQAVLDITWEEPSYTDALNVLTEVRDKVRALPPVNPQPKTGHWIYKQYGGYPEQGNYHCSECDAIDNRIPTYCPSCGARMAYPQERSDKE